jgi:hypothetical protein
MKSTKLWNIRVFPLSRATNKMISTSIDISRFVNELNSKVGLQTPSGDSFAFYATANNTYAVGNKFSVLVKGKISPLTRRVFYNAINRTWNGMATNSPMQFNQQWFSGNYQFVFVDYDNYLLDGQNQFYTSIDYFITYGSSVLSATDFNQIPNYQWFGLELQNIGLTSYRFIDPLSNQLALQPYDSFYAVDFNGYIDPSSYTNIQQIINNVFTQAFKGIQLRNYQTTYLSYCLPISTEKLISSSH